MSDLPIPPRDTWTREQVEAELNGLLEARFISGWHHEGTRWWITAAGEDVSYSLREMGAWLNGAHTMGGW